MPDPNMRILREKLLLNNPKAQKDFNNKIGKEQRKITEEINEMTETSAREMKKNMFST